MSGGKAVRFSVVMPVFNQHEHLGKAIGSVLSQTFTNFELIVIDDGSTDGSLDLIRTFGPRVELLQQGNQGPEVARNLGAAQANGEYLVFLDGDDFFFPYALEVLDRVIRHFRSPPFVLATLIFFDDEQAVSLPSARPIKIFRYKTFLSRTRPVGTGTTAANLTDSIVVRKTVFDEIGGMRHSNPETFHNEDSHLLLKLGALRPCIVIDQPAITAYRRHAANSSGNVSAIAEGWLRIARAERRGEYAGTNKWGRYAHIGGRTLHWAINYCWPEGHRKLALRLLVGTSPMIAVALVNKAARGFQKSEPAIVLK
jgi:glycosyltransferase involved in cell wall biosynthesis